VQEGISKYPVFDRIRGHVIRFLLYRVLLPFSHHAFVQTEEMRKNISKNGISKEKMTAVPMAVSIKDISLFCCEREPNSGKEKIVVYLGALTRGRKMDFLLRAFEGIYRKEKNARLYLVGGSKDLSDEKFLGREAKKLGIEKAVTITGFLPQNEAWQYVKQADVCVSPIYPSPVLNCGSPTKLLEYMAMGKAVVASDHPEQRLIISESKGGICVPYEEAAFTKATVHLLENPQIARRMGERGRTYIEKKRNYEQTANVVETKLLGLIDRSPF
jgi:glycosyltransferase involved in cell wall biosynthesis